MTDEELAEKYTKVSKIQTKMLSHGVRYWSSKNAEHNH